VIPTRVYARSSLTTNEGIVRQPFDWTVAGAGDSGQAVHACREVD
jgi:hypothetical protein